MLNFKIIVEILQILYMGVGITLTPWNFMVKINVYF